MKYWLTFEEKKKNDVDFETQLKYARIPKEWKEEALNLKTSFSEISKSKVYNLQFPTELNKKIKEKSLPSGFSLGIDKDGYFIYTHRARSKSYDTPNISIKDIKFIDSTG